MGRLYREPVFTPAMTLRIALWMMLVTISDRWGFVFNQHWHFDTQIDADVAFQEYVLQETEPWSAMLCPSGFFISQIDYFFTVTPPHVNSKRRGPHPPHPPHGQPPEGHPPPEQGHPPPGEGHPPPDQGHPPPDQGHPPPGQGHPHPDHGHPPHPPPEKGHPPPEKGNSPPEKGPLERGHLVNDPIPPKNVPIQGYDPDRLQMPPQIPPQGYVPPEGQDPEGRKPQGQGQNPPQGQTPPQGQNVPPGQKVQQGQNIQQEKNQPQGKNIPDEPNIPQAQTIPHGQRPPKGQIPPPGQVPPQDQGHPVQGHPHQMPHHDPQDGKPPPRPPFNPWAAYVFNKMQKKKEDSEATKYISTDTYSLYTLDALHFARIKAYKFGLYRTDRTVMLNAKFNGSEVDLANITYLLDAHKYLNYSQVPDGYGPCPSLIRCIGHQACTFRYSNDFCHNDPLPGKRKMLMVRMHCGRKNTYSGLLREYAKVGKPGFEVGTDMAFWPETVNYIKYKSLVAKGIKTYNSTLHEKNTFIKDVFYKFCPLTARAKAEGYYGECTGLHPPIEAYASHFWKLSSRANDSKCRDELLEVFCAYHYSPIGQCRPPFLNQNHFSHSQSYQLQMPETGKRYDLTRYYEILKDPGRHLIPARIGFMILIHSSPESVIEILHQIYRPQNFYVVHIDVRAVKVRKDLNKMLQITYPDVVVVPIERSFASSWGSFQIMRAQFECFEELLRLGVWDFAVLISGSDLPIRDVDDFAWMLAPFRDKNFIGLNSFLNTTDDMNFKTVWHGCGGHLFKVSHRMPQQIPYVSHSNWVTLNRAFTEYMLSKKNQFVNELHFCMITSLIPDESYMGTILVNSHFKNSMIASRFHHTKPFEGRDADNLCRHSDETDTCGQGPSNYEETDTAEILQSNDKLFLARKFNVNLDDKARQQIIKSLKDASYYDRLREEGLTDNIIRELANMTLQDLSPGSELGTIKKWRVVPLFSSEDPACRRPIYESVEVALNYRIIIEAFVKKDGKETLMHLIVTPRLPFYCFPNGQLRVLQVSTRFHLDDKKLKTPRRTNAPHPSSPTGVLFLTLMFDTESGADDFGYFVVPDPEGPNPMLTPVTATIKDLQGRIFCHHHFEIDMDTSKVSRNFSMFAKPLVECGNITNGFWIFQLNARNSPMAFVYEGLFHIADVGPSYEAQVTPYLRKLWKVEDLAPVDEGRGNHYYEKIPLGSSENFITHRKSTRKISSTEDPGGNDRIQRKVRDVPQNNVIGQKYSIGESSESSLVKDMPFWSFIAILMLAASSSGVYSMFYSKVKLKTAACVFLITWGLLMAIQLSLFSSL